jgi:sugar O-acyltransferase (sialic acid O-acetyltransferase NeuD family)
VKPLVIFGTGEIAQLARFYFSHDSDRRVDAFTVDPAFLSELEFCGLPVIPFDEIAQRFPPHSHDLFVALSYSQLNRVRKEKYLAGKAMGYGFASYVSSRATVFPGMEIGENCFILEDNTLQPFAVIRNNVTLWSGNHIGHHSEICDHCFLASHIVVSGGVTIGESCFIGVNATLRDHIAIGEGCVIGAGALILGDTEPQGVYVSSATERSKVPSSRLRKI